MNIKETFLKFTEYTVPFGYESKLVPLLKEYVPNLRKDSVGNYFCEIGENSETLFTTHLDTYSEKYQKVNHKINGEWIGTDGNTILGGDNKNGLVILLYLIEKKIPGTYYFFIGEEPILSGGLYGSSKILSKNKNFFKKFKRAIAFDRKKTGSIVTRQLARKCCSNEFADYLIDQFRINGMKFEKDPNAYYTDTASFLDIIPEITNISAGGWGEHTKFEKTLITYTEAVAEAASNIRWEELPVMRTAEPVTRKKIKKFRIYNKTDKLKTKKTFNLIDNLLDTMGFMCLNYNEFDIGNQMVFSHWHKDVELNISIIKDEIYIDDKKIGNFIDFKNQIGIKFNDLLSFSDLIEIFTEEFDNNASISIEEMEKILEEYFILPEELINLIKSEEKIREIIDFVDNKFIIKQ